MRSVTDCIPCLARQTLNLTRMAGGDDAVQEAVLRQVLQQLSRADFSQPAPRLVQDIQRQVMRLTQCADPCLALKQESNRIALSLLPHWRQRVREDADPRRAAVQIAIAANAIDFAVKGERTAGQIPAALEQAFQGPLQGPVEELFAAAETARDILFLADNAGELVFDRLLIEALPQEKLTLVVKDRPALNDALPADAEAAGLDALVPVITNGSDGPGTLLESCSPDFCRRFEGASLIISKGQGNFECLHGGNKSIFFLFQVKCPTVARQIGREVGSLVVHRNS